MSHRPESPVKINWNRVLLSVSKSPETFCGFWKNRFLVFFWPKAFFFFFFKLLSWWAWPSHRKISPGPFKATSDSFHWHDRIGSNQKSKNCFLYLLRSYLYLQLKKKPFFFFLSFLLSHLNELLLYLFQYLSVIQRFKKKFWKICDIISDCHMYSVIMQRSNEETNKKEMDIR